MLKNTVFKTASHALGTPIGTSVIGPDAPVNGQIRYNSSSNKLEYYSSSAWKQIAKEGNVTVINDSFTGVTSQTDFSPMSYSYSAGQEAQVLIFVGAVFQIPGTNYTFYGNTQIHFTSAPSNGSAITILHNYSSTITA
jgi:hypothetical protein